MTVMLNLAAAGDAQAASDVVRMVYDELRRIAGAQLNRQPAAGTLQPTALVHEAYIRLIKSPGARWSNRAHFFGAAAEAMRQILIEHARARGAVKRGGGRPRQSLESIDLAIDAPPDELLDVDEALQRLEKDHAQAARMVKLRFYASLSLNEIASVMDVAPSTVDRYWAFARAWLYNYLTTGDDPTRTPPAGEISASAQREDVDQQPDSRIAP
jgi:RNA polymerase sigma factor (TIGR02999 family)